MDYNAGDCQALELTVMAILDLGRLDGNAKDTGSVTKNVVNADSLETRPTMWPRFSSSMPAFNQINKSARWDYQRDRIYARADERIQTGIRRKVRCSPRSPRINKAIVHSCSNACPNCGRRGTVSRRRGRTRPS